MWSVYIIEKDGKLYTGITTDLSNRLRQHGKPKLLYVKTYVTREKAVQRERQIKGWSKTKKLTLTCGKF